MSLSGDPSAKPTNLAPELPLGMCMICRRPNVAEKDKVYFLPVLSRDWCCGECYASIRTTARKNLQGEDP